MTKAKKRDDEDADKVGDAGAEIGDMETHPKRTTSFVARLTHKKHVHYDLATRIAMERENSKYWARILLLFPLAPVCAALSTVVIGGVIINVATNNCNASLMTFMQGAVMLSYVLIWFCAYCWMEPSPIKSLRTVRVFYLIYGVVCIVWWGIYGTLQATSATSSGFQSCLSMSPSLYIVSQYEVAIFWILFLVFLGFVVNERTAKLRQEKLDAWNSRKSNAKKRADAAEEAMRTEILEAAQEKAQQEEDELRKQSLKAAQEQLYKDSDGEDEDAERDDLFVEEDNTLGVHVGVQEAEEEEVLLTRVQGTAPS
ncbi:hypothetical protein FI667_g15765, partial [Globisporangium splendens]